MAHIVHRLRWSVVILASYFIFTRATPVQYCKTNSDYNFCVAMESFPNATSSTTDAYITFVTTRDTNSDLGWNAVGIGEEMAGALMFVMYGDPKSKTGPTVSVRTATGHNRPQTLANADSPVSFPDVRVVGAEYVSMKDSPQNTLAAHILCYGCDAWTRRADDQPFQSWIWAVNTNQDFAGNLDVDVSLSAHSFTDGMGVFWANVDRSLATDQAIAAVPAITSTKTNVNTQDTAPPGFTAAVPAASTSSSFRSRMWGIHGFLLAVSFFVLHPLGIIAMRGGIPHAFKYHWLVQAAATTTSLVGILIGILLSHHYRIWHQWLGFLLLLFLVAQPVLGWQHHVIYLRTRSKTVLSPYHIWLGHTTQMLGWINLMLGMAKKHWSYTWIMLTMALMMVEMGAVFFSPALLQYTRQYKALGDIFDRSRRPSAGQDQAWEEYLDMSDQGEDEEEEPEVYSSEAHGAMPGTGLMAGIPKEGLDDEPADKRTWLPADKR